MPLKESARKRAEAKGKFICSSSLNLRPRGEIEKLLVGLEALRVGIKGISSN